MGRVVGEVNRFGCSSPEKSPRLLQQDKTGEQMLKGGRVEGEESIIVAVMKAVPAAAGGVKAASQGSLLICCFSVLASRSWRQRG